MNSNKRVYTDGTKDDKKLPTEWLDTDENVENFMY